MLVLRRSFRGRRGEWCFHREYDVIVKSRTVDVVARSVVRASLEVSVGVGWSKGYLKQGGVTVVISGGGVIKRDDCNWNGG